ncbi:septum site-determining protein Ssd [Tersicoccus mangrovi]|uniref:septum site-determining protein Ssd n=1 Tax=Tersicoccus mangrovi TaxID=3121635 RepID=UPI002FE560FC
MGPGVVAVTGSALLRAEIERVASAAGRSVVVIPDVVDAGTVGPGDALIPDPVLPSAPVVLLGSDVALAGMAADGAAYRTRDRPRPGTTIIVGLAGEGAALWDAATHWGADRVAVVPEASAWLVDVLAEDAATPRDHDRIRRPEGSEHGVVLGVIGACGGLGSTALCVAVAEAARRAGTDALLIDADPLGGTLEVALDAVEEPGVRWAELGEAVGRIPGDQLREAVPRAQGLPLLTGAADAVPATVLAAVAAASREAFAVALVDVGRDRGSVREWNRLVDRLVVVLPPRPVDLGGTLTAALAAVDPARVLAVVAGSPPDGLDAEEVAASAGVRHYVAWPGLAAAGRRLTTGHRPADLAGRRCHAPSAVLHFAIAGAPG